MSEVMLTPFLEDRRGRSARSERDFAALAEVYISSGQPNRQLARDLAARHGMSVQTWRNHLVKAKRYIVVTEEFTEDGELEQVHVLTDEAMRLIYGDDYASTFEDQELRDRELAGAMRLIRRHEAPQTDAERAAALFEARRNGANEMARRLAAARRVVETYGRDRD